MATTFSGNKPHVMAVAAPAQGHVKPLMSLCRQISKHGIKVTFVNAQSIHDRIVASSGGARETGDNDDEEDGAMVLASVPDGLSPDDDQNDPIVLVECLKRTMPKTLPDLIERINSSNPNQKISCVIADLLFGWVLDITGEMGIEGVGFSPPSMASLAVLVIIPDLIQQGLLDTNGTMEKTDEIKLSDDIPSWRKMEVPWNIPSNLLHHKKAFFEMSSAYKAAHKVKWVLSNSCYELEPAACDLNPNYLPIGPLHLMETKSEKPCSDSSNFYPEDESCLEWLDTKPRESVVYVSFGSFAVHSKEQLDELALGLEISGRPFLWVVRQDVTDGSRDPLPDGFLKRVGEFGKIVEWAPQKKVLSHPAIACFVSHCGWNSILEGVSSGVPYLCWPYFCDQPHDESYICDKWEIGLRLDCNENGIRSRHEIKKKIDMLLSDSKAKENVMKLKELCAKSIAEGGSSSINLEKFIDHLRK